MTVDRHIYCAHCGYDLFGLKTHVCPECGTQFSPLDPGSYRLSPARETLGTQLLSLSLTLLMGFLLGCFVTFMMLPPPSRLSGAVTSVFLIVGVLAFILHYSGFRSTLDMCLAAFACEAWVIGVVAPTRFLGGRLMDAGDIVVTAACTVVPWVLGMGVSLAIKQARAT